MVFRGEWITEWTFQLCLSPARLTLTQKMCHKGFLKRDKGSKMCHTIPLNRRRKIVYQTLLTLQKKKWKLNVLFSRLSLSSTLIRRQNGAFQTRNFKTHAPCWCFSLDKKHFKNVGFQKRWRLSIHVINRNPQVCTQALLPRVIVSFWNFSGVVWTENVQYIFGVKIRRIYIPPA